MPVIYTGLCYNIPIKYILKCYIEFMYMGPHGPTQLTIQLSLHAQSPLYNFHNQHLTNRLLIALVTCPMLSQASGICPGYRTLPWRLGHQRIFHSGLLQLKKWISSCDVSYLATHKCCHLVEPQNSLLYRNKPFLLASKWDTCMNAAHDNTIHTQISKYTLYRHNRKYKN